MEFEYFDISPVISNETAVFPGDTRFKREVAMSFKDGQHLDLSSIHTTVHIGAHTDAPSHYHGEGRTIDKQPLHYYLGRAQVVSLDLSRNARARVKDLAAVAIAAPRVLFKTHSFPDPNNWNSDFNSLSAELVQYLHDQGVILVGIDTPSVDPETDKELESHKSIYQNNMAILEGIVLTEVPDGLYNLIALPLKIKEADASPVRAVLTKLP